MNYKGNIITIELFERSFAAVISHGYCIVLVIGIVAPEYVIDSGCTNIYLALQIYPLAWLLLGLILGALKPLKFNRGNCALILPTLPAEGLLLSRCTHYLMQSQSCLSAHLLIRMYMVDI